MKDRALGDLLQDMRGFAVQAGDFIGGMALDVFVNDIKSQFAVMHALQFLGEAARLVTAEDRERLPAVPWARIIGMRNIIAHNYLGVDPVILFDTVTIDLPGLIAGLDESIAALERP